MSDSTKQAATPPPDFVALLDYLVTRTWAAPRDQNLDVRAEFNAVLAAHRRTEEERDEWRQAAETEASVRRSELSRLTRERDEERAERDRYQRGEGMAQAAYDDLLAKTGRDRAALVARAERAERRVEEVEGALRPFAAFVFGPKWAGHAVAERDGEVNVLCGYDHEGKETGVDVNYSDFLRARALLSASPSPHAPAPKENDK